MTLAPSPTLNRPPNPAAARRSYSLAPFGPMGGRGIIPDPPGSPTLVRITVQQYDDWIERGILPTNSTVELIDGLLVWKDRSHAGDDLMSIGSDHRFSVGRCGKLDARASRGGSYVQSQQPVIFHLAHEPEPDAAFVRGTDEDFRSSSPTAADVTCVVEVSDSSLRTDRTTKLAVYAAARIPQYVIINLVDGQVEDHRDPGPAGYARRAVLARGEVVGFLLADGSTLDVPVAELLP